MLIISCRKDFENTNEITKGSDEIRDIDPKKSSNKKILGKYEFVRRISQKKILLLIHGYNNTFKQVISTYDKIDNKKDKFIQYHDMTIGYAWPGSIGWNRAFESAYYRSPKIVPRFQKLLKLLDIHAKEIHVMSHSLGCHISLAAYSRFGQNEINHVSHRQFLMAAAVDKESIKKGRGNFDGSDSGKSCHIFYNQNDGVLSAMYVTMMKQMLNKKIYALGADGPDRNAGVISNNLSKKVYALDCQNVLIKWNGHSGYKDAQEIYEYIKKVVNGGKNVSRLMDFPAPTPPVRGGP